MSKLNFTNKYWHFAFIEGLGVMAVELLGAKMLAPFYGSSLPVWSMVIGITLLGLAGGYFAGSRISKMQNLDLSLYYLLWISALLMSMLPMYAPAVVEASYHTGLGELRLLVGVLLATLGVIGLPMLVLGSLGPLIIQLSSGKGTEPGNVAGRVFTISTVANVIAALCLGFILIPKLGISLSFMLIPLLIVVGLSLSYRKKAFGIEHALFSALVLMMPFVFMLKQKSGKDSFTKLLYSSEGLLGQLRVTQTLYGTDTNYRILSMNGITQTVILNDSPQVSYWHYVHALSTMAALKPAGSKALALGLAGGSVPDELIRMGMHLDVVDLDERMYGLARDYFYLNELNFINEDARYYINTASTIYDLVIFDIISGEVQPHYVYTIESFTRLKTILAPDGLILMNFLGHPEGPGAFQSLLHTLAEAGFQSCYYFDENASGFRTINIFAAQQLPDPAGVDTSLLNPCCRAWTESVGFFSKHLQEGSGAEGILLTDDKPVLDQLNMKLMLEWRKQMIEINETERRYSGHSLFD